MKKRKKGERKKRRKGGRKRGKGRSKEKRKGKTEGGTREEKIIINSIFYMFHVKKTLPLSLSKGKKKQDYQYILS